MYPVQTWTAPVPRSPSRQNDPLSTRQDSTTAINSKLQRLILPKVEFHDTRIADAIEFLHQESIRLDTAEPDLDNRGVNIFVPPTIRVKRYRDDDPYVEVKTETPPVTLSPFSNVTLSLSLDHIPLLEAIKYTAQMVGLNVGVFGNVVRLESCQVDNQPTEVREYDLPPKYSLLKLVSWDIARKILEAEGIDFPDGTTAVYRFDKSKLVIRHYPEMLDLIDLLFTEASVPATPFPTPAPAHP